MASESSIQSNIIDYINSLENGSAENVSGNAQQSGRADINACISGLNFKIEVKTQDTAYGRRGASIKQRLYLEKWARAGAISILAYSTGDVKYMIERKFGYSKSMLHKPCEISGRGMWYDVQNKRWVDISY